MSSSAFGRVVNEIGIGPPLTRRPAVGLSTSSVGASLLGSATMKTRRDGSPLAVPVAGSAALISNSFRPPLRGTSMLQTPEASACVVTESPTAFWIRICVPAPAVPRTTVEGVPATSESTSSAGLVTLITGGLAKRIACAARKPIAPRTTSPTSPRLRRLRSDWRRPRSIMVAGLSVPQTRSPASSFAFGSPAHPAATVAGSSPR